MVVVKIIGASIVLYYAMIGALLMHTTQYDYAASVENCRELVTIYEEN